jgi:uncharacterized membrane protein
VYFRDKPFLCYRCFGINLGFFISFILQAIVLILSLVGMISLSLPIIGSSTSFLYRFGFTLAMQIPLIMDGTVQLLYKKYQSNNLLRLLTGTLGGVGQFYFVYTLGAFTGTII